jgi:hypothetical protein
MSMSIIDRLAACCSGWAFRATGTLLLFVLTLPLWCLAVGIWFWTGESPDISLTGMGIAAPTTGIWGINKIVQLIYQTPIYILSMIVGIGLRFFGGSILSEIHTTRVINDVPVTPEEEAAQRKRLAKALGMPD